MEHATIAELEYNNASMTLNLGLACLEYSASTSGAELVELGAIVMRAA